MSLKINPRNRKKNIALKIRNGRANRNKPARNAAPIVFRMTMNMVFVVWFDE
ncbi:hypothetical protein D3C86_2175260 [compost metagenome]